MAPSARAIGHGERATDGKTTPEEEDARKKTAGALGVERGTGGTRSKAGVYATYSRGWDTSTAADETIASS